MSRATETEAVVLRSIRYGEADRILHFYTPHDGRLGAIAKGARRTKSKFGARLEPFSRVRLTVRLGKSDLHTVTAVETLDANAGLRRSAESLDWAARSCDAVSRLLDGPEPHSGAFNLLVNGLALISADPGRASKASQVGFRLKLLVAAGLQPHLSSCARCGDTTAISGFSGADGGTVCAACHGDAFPIGPDSVAWMVDCLAAPLADLPEAGEVAIRQAERAVNETVEHHANVRLRPAAAR